MVRKFIVNLLVSLIALPLLNSHIYWKRIITHDYSILDAHYDSLSEFLSVIKHNMGVPYISIIYLILAMGPFQFIKDYYFYSRKKGLKFIFKALTLSLITTFLWFVGLARYVRTEEMTLDMFIFPVSVGIILSFLLHVFLDRYIEKETHV